METVDVIDAMLDDKNLAALRRPDFVRYSQGSHDVLIVPDDPGGLSLSERAASAWRISVLNRDEKLAAHYQALLDPATAMVLREANKVPPRLAAILAHVELVAVAPGRAASGNLRSLEAAGLSAKDIVGLSQLIAFVSFQVRVLAGMRLLSAEDHA